MILLQNCVVCFLIFSNVIPIGMYFCIKFFRVYTLYVTCRLFMIKTGVQFSLGIEWKDYLFTLELIIGIMAHVFSVLKSDQIYKP